MVSHGENKGLDMMKNSMENYYKNSNKGGPKDTSWSWYSVFQKATWATQWSAISKNKKSYFAHTKALKQTLNHELKLKKTWTNQAESWTLV